MLPCVSPTCVYNRDHINSGDSITLTSARHYIQTPIPLSTKSRPISEILGGPQVYQILMSLFLYSSHCIDNGWLTAIPVQHLSTTSTGILPPVLPKQHITVSLRHCPVVSQPTMVPSEKWVGRLLLSSTVLHFVI